MTSPRREAMLSAEALADARRPPRIPLVPLGFTLGVFLTITFLLCIGYDLIFPAQAMYRDWQHLLPGFTWLSWGSVLIGVIETFAYGWYVALLTGPLFNFFSQKCAP